MQAYAYCGCYYNDPANLTSCANGELQSKAASSQTLVPGSTLLAPASASSTVPPVPPTSIYPAETANAITNAPPPPLPSSLPYPQRALRPYQVRRLSIFLPTPPSTSPHSTTAVTYPAQQAPLSSLPLQLRL
ncbi:hypothetical protein ABVK25_008181 [Lepraria finkii]|uniref:Uncharacterized protein n=1 Tax=Lepraria finkii TaxID=1340010 RepID=A0ABR4B101_9LECA